MSAATGAPPPSCRTPATASFAALGTTAVVAVADPGALPAARDLLARQVDELDRACSRFRPDSELRALERADGRERAASPLLRQALNAAVRAARITGGLVTPALGRSLALAGYDRRLVALVPRPEPPCFAPAPPWEEIAIDDDRGTVRIPSGMALDLGATAKALAADRAATAIAAHAGCGALVSLGGDLRACGPAPDGGWPVAVHDGHQAACGRAARIRLAGGGLATSSTTTRRWRRGAGELHHVLDPRTGRPAREVWRTVSVAAATCLDANIASTAAIVLGADAPRWLRARRLPARLVAGRGTVVTVAGWPAQRP